MNKNAITQYFEIIESRLAYVKTIMPKDSLTFIGDLFNIESAINGLILDVESNDNESLDSTDIVLTQKKKKQTELRVGKRIILGSMKKIKKNLHSEFKKFEELNNKPEKEYKHKNLKKDKLSVKDYE